MRTMTCRIILVAVVCLTAAVDSVPAEKTVELQRTPNRGIQPKSVTDASGSVHLIYYRGEPTKGDVFYIRSSGSRKFTKPVQVNSTPGSALSMGTIRGAQLAVGREQRVHVVWNSSPRSQVKPPHPMLYARIRDDGSGFGTQRVVSNDWEVDGGGAVAADGDGNVYVMWHSGPRGSEEKDRRIYLRRSTDDGASFGREQVISPPGTGVCGCCAMQATADRDGNLYVAYRAAGNNVHRDITLLVSNDQGASFQNETVDRWRLQACPMSSLAFGELPGGMLLGWETADQIHFGVIEKGTTKISRQPPPPGKSDARKHPVFGATADGRFVVAWTEGTGWEKGGALAWQVYDAELNATLERGRFPGVSVWSFASAYARSDHTFTILH